VTSPAKLLETEVRRDGTRPFITAYDAAGGRVELSVATTANWVAKTAGYLEDEHGIEPGDRIAVDPTLHWLTAVVFLAGSAVGADVVVGEAQGAQHIDVPLDPMGAGFSRLVAAYPDHYVPSAPAGDVSSVGLPAGARVLTTLPLDETGIGVGLLGPLAAGGSVVYLATADAAAKVAAAERVTHTAGIDVPGLPRLC